MSKAAEKAAEETRRFQAAVARWKRDPIAYFNEVLIDPETAGNSKTARPFQLYPEEINFFRAALTPNPDGTLNYTELLFGAPKKSGKTAIAAMSVLYVVTVLGGLYAEGYCMANDLEQASDRVFKVTNQIVEKSPILNAGAKYRQNKLTFPSTGATIQPLAVDAASAAGGHPVITTFDELWGYTCLDVNTECLTVDGWKVLSQLSAADKLATLDLRGQLVWQQPSAINVHDYDGEMLRFKHRRADMLVTPNHRVYGRFSNNHPRNFRFGDSRWQLCEATEAARTHHGWLKADAKWRGREYRAFVIPADHKRNHRWPEIKLKFDAFVKVFGWYIAEGSITSSQWEGRLYPNGICISQSYTRNPTKHAEIGQALAALGVGEPSKSDNGWILYHSQLARWFSRLGKAQQKFIPAEIKNASRRQLRLLFESYLKGDGWRAGHAGWQACTVSPRLADDLMEVGLKCGWMPRLMSVKPGRTKHRRPIVRLSFSRGTVRWEKAGRHWTREHYKGKVWCPTLPNGVFYIRRNGKCCWTGNSEAAHRMWDEMMPVPTKKVSVRLTVTYAGFEGESDLLEALYKRGMEGVVNDVKVVDPIEIAPDLYKQSGMLMYWTHRHCAPWQTPKWIEEMRRMNRPSQFKRVIENYWVGSSSPFIPIEDWDACIPMVKGSDGKYVMGPDGKPIPALKPEEMRTMTPVFGGVDASVKRDSTALVLATFEPESEIERERMAIERLRAIRGPIGLMQDIMRRMPYRAEAPSPTTPMELRQGQVRIIWHQIWQPSPDNPLDFERTIENALIFLKLRFALRMVYYDPYQMVSLAQRLVARGIPMVEFPQTPQNLTEASSNLYDLIKGRRIAAYPNPEIRLAMSRAVAVEGTRGWRIAKEKAAHKIDVIVAMAQAALGAAKFGRALMPKFDKATAPISNSAVFAR